MKKAQSQYDHASISDNQPARDRFLLKKKLLSGKKSADIEMRSVGEYSRTSSIKMTKLMTKKRITASRIATIKQKTIDLAVEADNQAMEGIKQRDEKGISDSGYDIWDLTYTMMSSQIPILVSSITFAIFVIIRYYTLGCLIYVATKSHDKQILWILVIVVDRILYMILVIKISLENPQTRTEIVLKSHWNSKQSQISQLFEVINTKKLMISIIRGIIPAELAFLYIRAQPRRKFQLYTAINYINSSIEAVLYYPFFIAYCAILTADNSYGFNKYYQNATIGFAVLAQIIIMIVSLILVFIGIRRKYGRLFFCFPK